MSVTSKGAAKSPTWTPDWMSPEKAIPAKAAKTTSAGSTLFRKTGMKLLLGKSPVPHGLSLSNMDGLAPKVKAIVYLRY